MNEKKRILVLTNNPLSLESSNGRTIFNMLGNFQNKDISNFYITSSGQTLIHEIKYFQIEDRSLFPVCLFRKKKNSSEGPSHGAKRTASKMIIRNFLWAINGTKAKILNWVVKNGTPDAILVQLGDFSFMNRLAVFISKKLNLPLMTFISEDYFFKNYNYFSRKNKEDLMFRLFKRGYSKSVNDLFYAASHHVFLTEDLESLYKSRFWYISSSVIHNSSGLTRIPTTEYKKATRILYSGNLGVGRSDSLLAFAKILRKVDPSKKITVCTGTKDPEILEKIKRTDNIEFLGNVTYERLQALYRETFLNIHVESFDCFYLKDTKHAFSTKIADSLTLGIPFLVFAPPSSSTSKYLKRNNCAFVCDNEREIERELKNIIYSKDYSQKLINNALFIAEKNHNYLNNSELFFEAFKDIVSGNKIVALVTTVDKSEEEMLSLYKKMHLNCDAIIRSQNGKESIVKKVINGNTCTMISANDRGLSKNRNELLKVANHDYVFFCDDDEILNENTVNRLNDYIHEFSEYDAIEFSFTNEWNNCVIYKKRCKPRFFKNSGFGMLNIIFRKNALSSHKIRFDERIGAGTSIACGEDSVYKKDVYKLLKRRVALPPVLFEVKNDERPSTWFKGFTDDYYRWRTIIYGMIHPFCFPPFLLRMRIKHGKKYHLFKNFKYGFLGKKYRHIYSKGCLVIRNYNGEEK